MKKIMYASIALLFVIFLTTINAPANETTDADKAYDIMTKADEENRELTAEEITQVEKATKTLIAFDEDMPEEEKNVHRAISAMYLNFYETSSPYYEQAKESYEKYSK